MPIRVRSAGEQRRVFLYIGSPKTGTNYFQNCLWAKRDELLARGLLYPLSEPGEHFAVAMDVRRMRWGGHRDPAWDGTWHRVAERILESEAPDSVVASELLAGATLPQIRDMMMALPGVDVHVVYTARDIARQLPSDWQEQVKHTHSVTFERFVDDLVRFGRDAPAPFGEMFWDLHDPMASLPRWAEVVGRDRVHLVTLPPAGADRSVLWRRLDEAIGTELGLDSPPADVAPVASLGVAEAELFRRLNERRLADRLSWMYDGLARREFGEWILGRREGQRPLQLPERHRAWAVSRSREMVEGLRSLACPVVGDLDDLLVDFADTPSDDRGLPGAASDGELLDTAVDTIGALLLRLGVVQNPPE